MDFALPFLSRYFIAAYGNPCLTVLVALVAATNVPIRPRTQESSVHMTTFPESV